MIIQPYHTNGAHNHHNQQKRNHKEFFHNIHLKWLLGEICNPGTSQVAHLMRNI